MGRLGVDRCTDGRKVNAWTWDGQVDEGKWGMGEGWMGGKDMDKWMMGN